MKVAVIGSGISGLSAAYLAQFNGHEVHLFEKANYFGGHSNTIEINDGISSFYADTGFLIHNPKTYPHLIALLKHLNVKTLDTQMTLSIQILGEKIEWGGTNLATLFAQRKNLIRPKFYRMIFDIFRFNRKAAFYLAKLQNDKEKTLHDLLVENNYSNELRDWYIIPMAAAIWSTPADKILNFPAFAFLQFCLNHNLFQVEGRPTWRTIDGGSREYVNKIVENIKYKYLNSKINSVKRENGKVKLDIDGLDHTFDMVIFATHADQTIKLLKDIKPLEREILSNFKFQRNKTIVHSDVSLLPKNNKLWSAWNYTSSKDSSQVSVSYFINHLQNLRTKKPIIVTLNPSSEINSATLIQTIEYDHPLFDNATFKAQVKINEIQGKEGVYYSGAWLGYGFHEDGLKSSIQIAESLNWKIPWRD